MQLASIRPSCVGASLTSNTTGKPVTSQFPRFVLPTRAFLNPRPESHQNNGALKSSSFWSRRVATSAGRDVPSTTPWSGPPSPSPKGAKQGHLLAPPGDGPSLDLSTGLAILIALNAAIFVGAAVAKVPLLVNFALYNSTGSWLQFVSSAFVHANMAQLSRNLFLLWLWGSALRREVTGPGVWFTYVLSALGSNLAVSYALGAKAKAGTALLGVASAGGCAGVALAALILTARPSLRWFVGAALAVQFTFPALLAAPVPYMPGAAGGAASAGQWALTRLLPPWALSGVGEQWAGAGSLVGTAAASGGSGATGVGPFLSALTSPAMSWLWGAAAAALIVVILARLPVPPE